MKKLPLLFLLACANTFCLVAQPSIQWQKSLGGTDDDAAYAIQQTTDSGYVVAGYSYSLDDDVTGNHGFTDFWVVKLNSSGTIQWQKSLGGSLDEEAYSIQQTTDGGYILAGYSDSNDSDVTGNHGDWDYWVVKLDSAGTIQWQKSLGGSGTDWASSIGQTTDSGYIVAGYSDSNDSDVTGNHGNEDFWIVKLNNAGLIQWQKSLGGTGFDEGAAVRQTYDGGYIVTGNSDSNDSDVTGNHGNEDFWVVKLTGTGTIQWQKSLGGTMSDFPYDIQQTNDSGYVVAGFSFSNDSDVSGNHGGSDDWIVKLDTAGIIQWQKCLGGTGFDGVNSIRQTTDSGYVVAGFSGSNDGDVTGARGNFDYWVVKLNSAGIIQWQKCLGGTGDDVANSIRQTTDDGFIVAGYSNSNDSDITSHHDFNDYWVVKLYPVILGIESANNPLSNLRVMPNPVSQSTVISFSLTQSENISVKIYDITGRWVKSLFDGNLNSGNHEIKWNVTDERVDAGIYLLNFSANDFSKSFKLVVAGK